MSKRIIEERTNKAKENNRLLWVDFLRGVAMICVVYWHCSSITEFNAVTGGFYMPVFYALSGYLFNEEKGLQLKRLFKRIYIPLFVLGVLPAIIGPLFRLDCNTMLARTFYFLTSWFLPTFFASTVIFRLLTVYVKDIFLSMILSVFFMLLGFILTRYAWAADYYTTNICLSTILVGQCFIMMGFLWKKYEKSHTINLSLYRIISLIALCAFIILEFFLEPGSLIDIHTNSYPNFPLGVGIVLSSLILGYSWTRDMKFDLVWLKPMTNFVCFIGKYAIFVFLLHHYVIAVLGKLLASVYPHVKQAPVNALVYTILTLICCVIIIEIIRRFMPSLLGEKRVSKL